MINKTIEELNKMFGRLNKQIFEDKLELPIILVQTAGRRKNVLGWCTTRKIWEDKKGENGKYEITICAESLNREPLEIMETTLHEMVHLNNLINNVRDCSTDGNYHNKQFKLTAEKAGLVVRKDDSHGYAFTSLSDQLRESLKDFPVDKSAFEYFRTRGIKIPVKVPSYRYICDCGHKFTLGKEISIICGDCKKEFAVQENV